MSYFRYVLVVLSMIFLGSCTKSELSTDSSQTILSNSTYLTDQSVIRVYWRNSGLGTFITLLSPINGKLSLPKSMQKGGDYGARDNNTSLNTLDLVATVYNPLHPSGDFYFEAPILGPNLDISNVTTALTWYLRWGFAGANIRISQAAFNQMVLNVEVICDNCRSKTNTEVLNLIRNNSTLVNSIRQNVIAANPQMDLSNKTWITPTAFWAWSTPQLTLSVGTKNLRETEAYQFSAFYVNPLNSTQKINPTSWTDSFNSSTRDAADDGSFTLQMTYDDAGTHILYPHFPATEGDVVVPDDGISFVITVDDVNRIPYCANPLVVSMRANVLNSVSLSGFCADPDPDNGALSFTLEDGPTGSTINAGGLLQWTPASQGSSLYQVPFNFRTYDSKSGMVLSAGQIEVRPDQTPVFESIATDYYFTEAQEGTLTVTAKDGDGDPLTLSLLAPTIVSGYPDGAGILTNIVRTGSAGTYSFEVKFTPSYLQAIAVDGVATVKFRLNYDNSGGGLYDSTLLFDEREVSFHVVNADDPPVWVQNPTDVSAVEGTDIGGLFIGEVTDPNPNPTAMTYSVTEAGSDDRCEWASNLSVTESAGLLYLHGAPAYMTSEECYFRVSATDSNDLTGQSATFKITSANTNQPITLCDVSNACLAAPITEIRGPEGQPLTLDLMKIFNDPDMDTNPKDEREYYTYNCTMDLDLDGSYETNCLSMTDLAISFTPSILGASANPKPLSAGTYKTRLQVTDVGGASATHDFDLVIEEYATAMTITTRLATSLTDTGVSLPAYTVNEAGTYYLFVDVTAASGRPVDIYDYALSPSCVIMSGTGSCSAKLLVSPLDLSGNGTKTFIFGITPEYTEGDNYPLSFRNYGISLFAAKSDNAAVYSQASVMLTVNNTNRPPTGIKLSKGSFGCSGSSENADADVFVICINGALDSKNGNTWSKTYAVPLAAVDPDLLNGSYNFSLTSPAPGTIADGIWTIRFPSCAFAATTTLQRTYTMTVNDGLGGTKTREVQIKAQKIGASNSCM